MTWPGRCAPPYTTWAIPLAQLLSYTVAVVTGTVRFNE